MKAKTDYAEFQDHSAFDEGYRSGLKSGDQRRGERTRIEALRAAVRLNPGRSLEQVTGDAEYLEAWLRG